MGSGSTLDVFAAMCYTNRHLLHFTLNMLATAEEKTLIVIDFDS